MVQFEDGYALIHTSPKSEVVSRITICGMSRFNGFPKKTVETVSEVRLSHAVTSLKRGVNETLSLTDPLPGKPIPLLIP